MLGILWFTVWAAVGESFYDDNNWFTAENGDNSNMAFDWQRYVRDNFSDNLQTFARTYRAEREGDDEMTMQKAKSRLRMLKVFEYTGSPFDFDETNGNMLPLSEGEKYCTMGRHTKVDCNHCTCVAGQLYMCTGMICPEQSGRPRFSSKCREGKKRKIDSCNYCYCHNGHEFCSTKDCRLDHGHSVLRRPLCREGHRRIDNCNRCLCHNGEEYCTMKHCKKSNQALMDEIYLDQHKPHHHKIFLRTKHQCHVGKVRRPDTCNYCWCGLDRKWKCTEFECENRFPKRKKKQEKHCDNYDVKYIECGNRCDCVSGHWLCTQKGCKKKTSKGESKPKDNKYPYLKKCKLGDKRKLDSCNYCYCRSGQWVCQTKNCGKDNKFKDIESNKDPDNIKIYIVKHPAINNNQDIPKKSDNQENPGNADSDINKYIDIDTETVPKPHKPPHKKKTNTVIDQTEEPDNFIDTPPPSKTTEEPNTPTTPQDSPCIPNSETMNFNTCEICKCYRGKFYCRIDCNLMEIIPGEPQIESKPCKPGTKKNLSCDDCKCTRHKKWKCKNKETEKCRMLFGGQLRSKCTIGSRYRTDACNYCWCNQERQWQCTNHTCPNASNVLLRSKFECNVGAVHRFQSCNHCWCNFNRQWKCTYYKCSQFKLEHGIKKGKKVCDNFDVKYIACGNHCECVAHHWMCTQNPCKKDKKSREPISENHDPEKHMYLESCEPGDSRKLDSCNKCYCRYGQWFCQTKECGEKQKTKTTKPNKKPPNYKDSYFNDETSDEEWENPNDNSNDDTDSSSFEENSDQISDEELESIENDHPTTQTTPTTTTKRTTTTSTTTTTTTTTPTTTTTTTTTSTTKPVTEAVKEEKCTPGKRKKLMCRDCKCARGGTWNCKKLTNSKCRHYFANGGLLRSYQCALGRRQRIDACNYCWCDHEWQWRCSNHTCDSVFSGTLRNGYDHIEPFLRIDNYEDADFAESLGVENLNLPKCRSGMRKKANACNYCYCRKGHWFCENKQCGLLEDVPAELRNKKCKKEGLTKTYTCFICRCSRRRWECAFLCGQDMPIMRNGETYCREGSRRVVDACNYCVCYNGAELCTQRLCGDNEPSPSDFMDTTCVSGKPVPPLDQCNECICLNSEILCTENPCGLRAFENLNLPKCRSGMRKKADACNYCYCRKGHWFCESKHCALYEDVLLKEPVCVPGNKKRTKCQQCTCRNGKWLCSPIKGRGCRGFHASSILRRSSEPLCIEGTEREIDDCNFCVCNEGVEFCTQNSCWNNQPIPLYDMEPECLPGEMVPPLDQCNQCVCVDGQMMCTDNPCELRTYAYAITSKCKRGSSKKYKCHRCACYNDGWKCRLRKKCRIDPTTGKPFLRQRKKCKQGQNYKIDSCNICFCSPSGTLSCTRRLCPTRTQLFTETGLRTNEMRCIEGSRREVDSCNFCICKNGAEFCTKETCLDNRQNQQRSSKSECVEGQKYKMDDGCNYCVCQGGQVFCTSRACLVTVPEKNTGCSDGEITSAKDGCNMCVCLQGKLKCTNRDCSDIERNAEDTQKPLSRNFESRKRKLLQECIPGITYMIPGEDPVCPNHCICDRNEFLCTKRQCKKNDIILYSEPLPLKRPKFKSPKRVLKQEMCVENQPLPSDDPCNTCICLNDRKVCTIIPCSEADETKMDSDEVFLGYKPVKTSRLIKGNMDRKKKGTFCEPFTFFSPDNNRFCRNCFCLHNGLSLCLLNLCKYSKDIPHNHSPEEFNDVCTPGETGYPTKCVTCTCSDEAKWVCTREELAFCQERDCDEKDEFHMGFFPFCAGCKCSVKEWFCSIESETCQDYSNVTCPIGTFIHNPKQHCSLCLCGGHEEGSSNMCFTEAKCVRQIIGHLKN